MTRINLVAAGIIVAMALAGLGWLVPLHVPSAHDPGDLPPTMVPYLSLAVCGLTGLLLGVSAWRKRGRTADETQDNEAAEVLEFGLRETLNLVVWLVFALIIWLLLKFVGFEVAAGVTIAGGMLYGGMRKLWLIALTSVAAPVIIDRIAWYGLNVQLP